MNKAQLLLQQQSQRPSRTLGELWPQADPHLHAIRIRGVQDDTRVLQAGDAWLCLPAAQRDADRYSRMAAEAGAVLAIRVGRGEHGIRHLPVLSLPDMAQLGLWLRGWFQTTDTATRVIGVTGTDGKTSVTWMTRAALERALGACWSAGTLGWIRERESCLPLGNTTVSLLNNHRLLAAATAQQIPCVVMEVSSHGIAQQRIAGLPFTAAVWTTMGRDHLDYHPDIAHYRQCKADFIAAVAAAGATIVANADQADIVMLRGASPTHWYTEKTSDTKTNAALYWDVMAPQTLRLHDGQEVVDVHPVPPGSIHAQNLTAVAMLLIHHFRYSLAQAAALLRGLDAPPGRMQLVVDDADRRVFVDYAHTPEALSACLTVARQTARGRLLLVFGCGGERDHGKRPLMGQVATVADRVWITSDNPRNEDPEAIIRDIQQGTGKAQHVTTEVDRAQAIALATAELQSGDVLLIAGKGHEDYMEFEHGRRLPWSDREQAVHAMAASSC